MIIVVLFMAVVGLVIGSFCGATVWRIHVRMTEQSDDLSEDMKRLMSISRGSSMCLSCHHDLAPLDLIPLFSWLSLKGKCRYCRKPIGILEPTIEIVTAVLFVVSYVTLRPHDVISWIQFVIWLYLLGSLIILTAYDLKWLILPNVVIFPAMGITILSLAINYFTHGYAISLIKGPLLAASLVGLVFLGLANLMGGRLMGFGDVKLAILMGLMLGVKGLIVAMFIAFDVAAIVGIVLIVIKLRKRTDHIPFGPFLALGTIVAYLYTPQIIHWYMHSLGAA